MKPTRIEITGQELGRAETQIFGANLDWVSDVPSALHSERLVNPTFCGPADPGTGLAPHWKKMMEFSAGYYFFHEPGQNRVGGPAQRMHVTGSEGWLVQPHSWVREGERLRIRLWARCQGAPVRLRVGFRHRGLGGPDYGSQELEIDKSYFDSYECEISIDTTDDDCLAYCKMLGPGMVYFDRISARPVGEANCRPETIEAMRELALGPLRWPAGCLASTYHWKRGTGPEDERHDDAEATFHWGVCYTWGTDEYLELCEELGCRPHIIVNIGTGTPREAGEWCKYCAEWYRARGLHPREILWQIGNEHRGPHEVGHMDATQYAAAFQEYAKAVRSHYPCPLLATADLGQQNYEPYLDALLAIPNFDADFLSMHLYACRCMADTKQEALAFVSDVTSYGALLDELAAKLKQAGCKASLAVTEWGAFCGETHTDAKFYDTMDAGRMLHVTASLNEYCRRAQVLKVANIYSLLNFMPVIVGRGRQIVRTMRHEVLRFWRPLFPSTILETRISGPEFQPAGFPWIDALAGSNDKGRWLLLSNRHPDDKLTVQLPGEFSGGAVDRLLPTSDRLGYDYSETMKLSGDSIVLPPWSHARVQKF